MLAQNIRCNLIEVQCTYTWMNRFFQRYVYSRHNPSCFAHELNFTRVFEDGLGTLGSLRARMAS
jgi:hypothetical protein